MVGHPLAPYVTSLHVYDTTGEPGVHIGMPSTSLTLVLPVGDPLDVAWPGRPDSRSLSWASVAGLHTEPAEIRHGRRQQGVMLGLTSAGARALLGVPAAALAGHLVDLQDVAPGMRWLPEQLAESPTPARASVVADALVGALTRGDSPAPRAEVARALTRLGRAVPVAEVAAEVGFSRRHLGDLVRAETGLSPKLYQRLARFERSHALVAARTPLADVAARCGYADQAHLSREWSDLAGVGPREWRRRELPIVQDTEVDLTSDSHA